MTKPKPKNIESFQGIHNPPDKLYIKFKNVVLSSNDLFHTPIVLGKSRTMTVRTVKKIQEWMSENKIHSKSYSELYQIINRFIPFIELPEDDRKELFRLYKDTQLAKLELAIKGLKKAEKNIWNDEVKLIKVWNAILGHIKAYEIFRNNLNKKIVNYHQLLYDMLLPLLENLRELKLSKYKINKSINNLLHKFDYDYYEVAKQLIRYETQPYSANNIIKEVQKALNS